FHLLCTTPPLAPTLPLFPYTTLFRSRLLADELVRSGTDRLGLEPVATGRVVVPGRDDPSDAADAAVVEVHEVDERFLEVKDDRADRKSTRLNSSHDQISYAVFCLKKK